MGYTSKELKEKVGSLSTNFNAPQNKFLIILDELILDLQNAGVKVVLRMDASSSDASFSLPRTNGQYKSVLGVSSGVIKLGNSLALLFSISKDSSKEHSQHKIFVSKFHFDGNYSDEMKIVCDVFPLMEATGRKAFQDRIINGYQRTKNLMDLDKHGNINNSKYLEHEANLLKKESKSAVILKTRIKIWN